MAGDHGWLSMRLRRSARRWCREVLQAASPETLAALRIAVAALLLASEPLAEAPRLAALDPALIAPPVGFGWAVELLPFDAASVEIARWVLVAVLVTSLVGCWSRASMGLAALLGSYVLGAAQLHGDTIHHHHLIWLAALLSVAPCGDAWSVDAVQRKRRRRRFAYALPLVLVWLVLSAVYFFPGLWKLRESGLAWITSDNLTLRMYEKWWIRGGHIPALRPDRMPGLMQLGAAFVVGFELAFPLLVLASARTRAFAAGAGLVVHGLSSVLLHIHFPSLWICYLALIDVRRVVMSVPLLDRLARPRASIRAPFETGATLAVGSLLLAGIVSFGAMGIRNGWPFACYPTFQHLARRELVVLRAVGIREDGSEIELPPTGPDAPRWWAIRNALLGNGVSRERLAAFARLVAARPELGDRGIARVRLERAIVDVRPERWADPPLRAVPLVEVDVR